MFFRAESEIDEWCQAHKCQRGATLSLATVWQLAQHWYKDRMSPDFRGRTLDSVREIFKQLNLSEGFWDT